jgi:hypothetical protein
MGHPMATPGPDQHSDPSPRSLIRRVVFFSAAGLGVIAAFVIAYYLGAFAPR